MFMFSVAEVVCEWRCTVLYWWSHSYSTAGHTDAGSVCVSHPHLHRLGDKGKYPITANMEPCND